MRIKASIFSVCVQVVLIVIYLMVFGQCNRVENTDSSVGTVGVTLDFSSLPTGSLPAVFTIDGITGIRIYDQVKRIGDSLWLHEREEFPPGSGNWKDASVMLLFSQLPCKVSRITTEGHGHGSEARIVGFQEDGATQTAICNGGKQVLNLNTIKENPFTRVILSGQEAEWIKFHLE